MKNKLKMKRGLLIAIEGIDRTGKSTQTELLKKFLTKKKNKNSEIIKFPDRTTIFGKQIDAYLKSEQKFEDEMLHLLFSINRWELKNKIINSIYKEKINIILDRYSYSGIAYSHAKGVDWKFCTGPEKGLPKPDLVLYLNTKKIEELCKREGYGDEIYEKIDFQSIVKDIYDQKLFCENWRSIEALRSIKSVEKNISEVVEDFITNQKIKDLDYF